MKFWPAGVIQHEVAVLTTQQHERLSLEQISLTARRMR